MHGLVDSSRREDKSVRLGRVWTLTIFPLWNTFLLWRDIAPWNGMFSSMRILLRGSTAWLRTCGTKSCAHAGLLRERGPQLGRPYVDTVEASAFTNMKELRVQFRGDPWRILFAFDPNRAAILLVGGNKRGDKRWYKKHLPIADERFRRHLEQLHR